MVSKSSAARAGLTQALKSEFECIHVDTPEAACQLLGAADARLAGAVVVVHASRVGEASAAIAVLRQQALSALSPVLVALDRVAGLQRP